MRKFKLLLILVFGWIVALSAQEEPVDTMIYQVVEEMPRFPACEALDTTLDVIKACAQQQLLSFIYQNVRYPLEAQQNGNEGTVVLAFVVEKDGAISNPRVVRDIGGGCGNEALRVINAMVEQDFKWIPGKQYGEPVRVRINLPVKFKLEEPLPYTLVEGDTIYTDLETPLEFIGGADGLRAHMNEKLNYPEIGNDSCLIGTIDVRIIVDPSGVVRILEMTDFNELGDDFWYEAINAATSTYGKWKNGTYEGREVPAAYDLSVTFVPTAPVCETRIDEYNSSATLINEGKELVDSGEVEAGLEKMNKAIEAFPNDANFLFMRGQTHLDNNSFPEACEDLRNAQRISLLNVYDEVLQIICRQK